jgi:hypothetical protein
LKSSIQNEWTLAKTNSNENIYESFIKNKLNTSHQTLHVFFIPGRISLPTGQSKAFPNSTEFFNAFSIRILLGGVSEC